MFQLAVKAAVAVPAVDFPPAVRAGVARHTTLFSLAVRSGVAIRALVFHLPVRGLRGWEFCSICPFFAHFSNFRNFLNTGCNSSSLGTERMVLIANGIFGINTTAPGSGSL